MSFDEGAAVEPLACACRACRRGEVKIGSIILILGSGPVGLMALMASKAMGATKIIVLDVTAIKEYIWESTDLAPMSQIKLKDTRGNNIVLLDNKMHRLKKAREMGADFILDISKMEENEIIKNIIHFLGCKPSMSIECSGAEICVRIGMMATRMGGKFIIVGCGADQMRLPFMPAALSEIDMLGVFRYVNEYPTAIELISSNKVKAKEIITHHFKIEDSYKAFETAKTGNGDPIKIIIHPNPKWKAPDKSTSCSKL